MYSKYACMYANIMVKFNRIFNFINNILGISEYISNGAKNV